MTNIFIITKYLHRLSLIGLLIALAIIPLFIEVDLVSAFVFLPLIAIISFVISLMIEQQLQKLTIVLSNKTDTKQKSHRASKCVISKGFHCLHHCSPH